MAHAAPAHDGAIGVVPAGRVHHGLLGRGQDAGLGFLDRLTQHRRGRDPHDDDEQDRRDRPGPPQVALAGVHAVEEMPDGHAHQEDQPRDHPVQVVGKGQRIVVRQHQEDDRQRQVVVVRRAQFGDLAVFRIGGTPGLEVGDDDALVRHDDEEHVRRHDRGGKGAQVQHGGAAGEDLVVAPAHDHQQDEQQQHQQGRRLAQAGLAEVRVDQPAHRQRGGRDQDRLPGRQLHLGRVDQEQLGPHPIGDHQERRPRDPGHVAFPFEPDQVLGHPLGRDQVFLDVVEAAAMDLPFLSVRAGRQARHLAQAKVESDEIEGRADPADGGDDMRPADGKGEPIPDDGEIGHEVLLSSWDFLNAGQG